MFHYLSVQGDISRVPCKIILVKSYQTNEKYHPLYENYKRKTRLNSKCDFKKKKLAGKVQYRVPQEDRVPLYQVEFDLEKAA